MDTILTIFLLVLLALAVFFAVRSIRKRKGGCGCGCGCGCAGGTKRPQKR